MLYAVLWEELNGREGQNWFNGNGTFFFFFIIFLLFSPKYLKVEAITSYTGLALEVTFLVDMLSYSMHHPLGKMLGIFCPRGYSSNAFQSLKLKVLFAFLCRI